MDQVSTCEVVKQYAISVKYTLDSEDFFYEEKNINYLLIFYVRIPKNFKLNLWLSFYFQGTLAIEVNSHSYNL